MQVLPNVCRSLKTPWKIIDLPKASGYPFRSEHRRLPRISGVLVQQETSHWGGPFPQWETESRSMSEQTPRAFRNSAAFSILTIV